jgi:nucleoside kinase
MKGCDVVTTGYVSMDRIVKIRNRARLGFTSIIANADNATIYYGGCPINVSYLLARLGLAALPIVRVGGDWEGIGFRAFLEKGGVPLDAVEVVEGESTSNCYLIEDEEGEHITLFYPGAQDGKYSRPMESSFFAQARLALMTVGSTADNLEFFGKARAAKVPMAFGMKADFESFPPGALGDFLRYSKIIFTNEGERGEIESRMALSSIADLLDTANVEVIVTTKGKEGSVFYEKREGKVISRTVPAAKPRAIVDTTGSGDAYIAGFLFGYLKGFDTAACCGLGAALAAFIIEAVGCCTNAPGEAELLGRFNGKE